MLAAIAADAPSLDPHQESTSATLQPVAPVYSTLLQIDPYSYPNVISDVASEWKIAPDGLTYMFKTRPGIRFLVHWVKVKNYVAPPSTSPTRSFRMSGCRRTEPSSSIRVQGPPAERPSWRGVCGMAPG